MKLSEVAQVIIQPQYGFGDKEHQAAAAPVPANSVLTYEVELVELHKVIFSCPHIEHKVLCIASEPSTSMSAA